MGGISLGVCISRHLSRCLGNVCWTWGRQGSPYVGCQFWGYSCASNSSLALRMEAGKLALLIPLPVPAPGLSLLKV